MESKALELIRRFFLGRQDAYGLETKNGYKAIREPLTDELLSAHLSGTTRIGVYPILPGNLVKWSVFDFDVRPEQAKFADKILREPIQRVMAASIDNGLFPYLLTSKSRGYHNPFFFDEPIPAKDIRLLMVHILKQAGVMGNEAFSIEIFPKQDTVSGNGTGDGLGNFLWLPWHRQSVEDGRTVFIDSGFQPYPDQERFLEGVHLSKSENILSWVQEQRHKTEPEQRESSESQARLDISDLTKYLDANGIKYKVKEESTRTLLLLDRCVFSELHTTPDSSGDSAIVRGSGGKICYWCFHAHCKGKTFPDALRKISGDASLSEFFQRQTGKNRRGNGKSLSQFLSERDEIEKPLIKGLFAPGDLGFLVSSFKMGKTLLLTQLTLCFSMAVPFLGFDIPLPAKVLYLRFEPKDSRFRKRLVAMVRGLGGMEKVKSEPTFELVRGFNILDKKDFDWLIGMIEKHKPEVLILDPLYKMINLDLKDTSSAMPLLRRFDTIIERFPHLLIIIAHHLRKTVGDDKQSWDQMYGPMFFSASMDFEMRIRAQHRENPEFTLEYLTNDVPVDPITFRRDPDTLLCHVCDLGADHEEEILDFIGKNKPSKTNLLTWMAAAFGISRRQGQETVKRLTNQEKIIAPIGVGRTGHIQLPGTKFS